MTSAIGFREATVRDREAILALRKIVFPNDDREKQDPAFWDWQFARGRVFVAEADDRVVGHFAFAPQTYTYRDMCANGALALDVMTHPDVRRQKVFSRLSAFAAQKLERDFQIIIAFQIREAVRAGMEAGGWNEAARIPILLKPLLFRRAVASAAIRPLARHDFDRVDALVATTNVRQPRTSEFLAWRYTANPHWRYRISGFFEGSELRAFVVDRDAVLRGVPTLAIVDCGFSDARAFRHLVRNVCGRATTRLAAAFISRAHPAYRALWKNGFFSGPHRFRLLLQVFDEKLRDWANASWSLSWGDTDHL